jgi:hypothetical protein
MIDYIKELYCNFMSLFAQPDIDINDEFMRFLEEDIYGEEKDE